MSSMACTQLLITYLYLTIMKYKNKEYNFERERILNVCFFNLINCLIVCIVTY